MPRRSQPSHSQKHNKTLSQSTLEQAFQKSQPLSTQNSNELVNNCVRYILQRCGNNLPIRKADIQKHVLQNIGKNVDPIIKKVTQVLKNVYSFDLYLSNEGGAKLYLVSNALSYKPGLENTSRSNDQDEIIIANDAHKILIMLVLTHIFMCNNSSTEAWLLSFLRSLQIDPDKTHELFGNVRDFVTNTMIKQRYLTTVVDSVTKRITYVWGTRAEHEISKRALLDFVCKVYKDRTPKSWTAQFESAVRQENADESEEVEEMQE